MSSQVSGVPSRPVPDHVLRAMAEWLGQPVTGHGRSQSGEAQMARRRHWSITSVAVKATWMWPALMGAGGTELTIDPPGIASVIGVSRPSV